MRTHQSSSVTAEDFQSELDRIFASAGQGRIDVTSGTLHRHVGGYPGRNHRMPVCCEVMKRNMRHGDQIIHSPPSGQGASLTIRYKFPSAKNPTEGVCLK